MRVNIKVSREFYDEMRKFCESVEKDRGLKKYSQAQFTKDLAAIIPQINVHVTEKNKGKKKPKNPKVRLTI